MGSQCSFSRRGGGGKVPKKEEEFCRNVLNFMERLDDRIRCTLEETVAVVKPWEDIGSNNWTNTDWTNTFKFEVSSWQIFMRCFFMDSFGSRMTLKVPGIIREGDVGRAKSNWIREGNSGRFQGRQKGKEKSFCFVVMHFELGFDHPCFYFVCACIQFFGEVGHFTERSRILELCVISKKLMIYRVVSYDIGERCSVQGQKRKTGPTHSTEPWGTQYMSCNGNEDELLTKVDGYLPERYD